MGCGASAAAQPPHSLGPLVPIGDQPDLRSLRRIDEHIKLAPPEAAQTLQSLAAYIESAASTELEKVRAVYMWITGNITLDSSETKAQLSLRDAESALQRGIGAKNEFNFIAHCLLRIFGVASKQITGFAKDFGYSPLKALTVDTRVNHDWLAVRVDGKWGFMDCLLGSGCFSDSGVFERRQTDFYFLPAPEVFLSDHFPLLNSNPEASKPWQLMKDPIDLETFHSRVRRREACYRLGVQLRSHSSALIDSSGQMKLRFWAAQNPLSHFGAAFFNLETGERCRSSLAAAVLDWRCREAVVLVRVPTSGTYWELRLFAAIELTSVEDAHLEWLAFFYLKSSGPVDKEPFPDFDGFYGAKLDPHIFGFKKEFGSSDGFCIEVDGGECSLRFPTYMPVRVSPTLQFAKALDQQSSSCSVEMDYLMLTVRIRMSRAGFYRLTLNCKDIYSVSSAYTEFANFLIRCKKPLPKLVAFPRLWHHRHLVKLVSHTEESIQVYTEAVLKFKGTGKPLKQFIARFVHPRTGQRVSGQHIAAVLDYRRNEATVTARPPTSGTFWELQVFASTDDEASASDVIASYQILARQTSSASPFPDFSGFYGLCSSPRKFGFSANFGDSQEFWLKTPVGEFELRLPTLGTVRAMAVLKPALKDRTEQQLCTVESNSRLLSIRTRILRPGFYRLTLSCAEADEPNSFAALANFLVECAAASSSEPQPGRQRADSKLWRLSDTDSGVAYDDW
ncbi:hypothetical protein BOX15_Mlig003007g4 [Macrostomum lignano]|uniref:Uncharacterized protein n=1 Tax=Macrostomum lignano TaxID=282301 RepID=A0A267DPS8_9PLAT|nr:hypothetical protein BOX15_Mlig003007g4 [Macrostomum lignano]